MVDHKAIKGKIKGMYNNEGGFLLSPHVTIYNKELGYNWEYHPENSGVYFSGVYMRNPINGGIIKGKHRDEMSHKGWELRPYRSVTIFGWINPALLVSMSHMGAMYNREGARHEFEIGRHGDIGVTDPTSIIQKLHRCGIEPHHWAFTGDGHSDEHIMGLYGCEYESFNNEDREAVRAWSASPKIAMYNMVALPEFESGHFYEGKRVDRRYYYRGVHHND